MNIDMLPYENNLMPRYQTFSDLDGFVLLESQDQSQGRYDILSANPYDEWVLSRGQCAWQDVPRYLSEKIARQPSCGDLPFQGGMIGFVTYDAGEAMLNMASHVPLNWQDMPWADFKCYDWAIVTDHKAKQVYLLTPNQKRKKEALERWYSECLKSSLFTQTKAFFPLLEKAHYQRAFDDIHAALRVGRAYQVNLTQAFLAHYEGDPFTYFQQIRQRNPVPYAAFLRSNDADILCFSPERFLTIDHGNLLTSPIKGTARRAQNPDEDEQLQKMLLNCPKNRAENVMIVDLLRNDLSRISHPGSVQVSALCELQSFAKVHHLVSHIEAQCKENISPWEAFFACFPGGSITGAPKIEAMRIIHEQEAYARGIYCGSIVYYSAHGRLDSNIAIRTMIARNNVLLLQAGGGIVIDSDCEEEYQECLTKTAAFHTT